MTVYFLNFKPLPTFCFVLFFYIYYYLFYSAKRVIIDIRSWNSSIYVLYVLLARCNIVQLDFSWKEKKKHMSENIQQMCVRYATLNPDLLSVSGLSESDDWQMLKVFIRNAHTHTPMNGYGKQYSWKTGFLKGITVRLSTVTNGRWDQMITMKRIF